MGYKSNLKTAQEYINILRLTCGIRAAGLCLTLVASVVASTPLLAVDCSGGNITLDSQSSVDNFQANYGGGGTCDRVPGSLVITGNMLNLDGLSALTSVGQFLQINSNSALTNLDGLSALTTVDRGFEIVSNSALTHLDGLSALSSVGESFTIVFNGVLADVSGLSSLVSVGSGFQLFFNPMLASIDGLTSLNSVGGFINIISNNTLAHVDGFSALTTVGGNFSISTNSVLTHLNGFANLVSVGGNVSVETNPLLSDCRGLASLLDHVDDGLPGPGTAPIPDVFGTVTISNNQPGCNSVAEIFLIFEDGFES